MSLACPKCGKDGGVLLFTSVAPCDRCAGISSTAKASSVDYKNWKWQIGDRVKRGPDWSWGDQDIDKKTKLSVDGTVRETELGTKFNVEVKWDHNEPTDWYRGGAIIDGNPVHDVIPTGERKR